jgi:ABC-type uncharacterized transport system substrate-binding protein
MTRRHFFFLLSSSAVWLWSARGHAVSQPAAKVPRIGLLVSASEPHPFADALRHGLQKLGYSEGRNITLDVRYTQGRSDLAAQFAAELVKSDVAVIVAHFTPAVRAAMAATEYAAVYVDKLLKGANPAQLPVEQPSKFQVTVNSRTAQALGLSLSPILLAQVDEVIE